MGDSGKSQKNNSSTDTLGVSFGTTSNVPDEVAEPQHAPHSSSSFDASPSHLSNEEHVFDVSRAFANENAESGTIINDRKKHHAPLKDGLRSAFNEWWGKTKRQVHHRIESLPEVRQEEVIPTVPKAETRKHIVQEAVSPASLPPHDDHHVVLENIRTFKRDVAIAQGVPFAVKEAPQKTQTWSHVLPENAPRATPGIRLPSYKVPPVVRKNVLPPTSPTGSRTVQSIHVPEGIVVKQAKMQSPVIARESAPVARPVAPHTAKLEVPTQKTPSPLTSPIQQREAPSVPPPVFHSTSVASPEEKPAPLTETAKRPAPVAPAPKLAQETSIQPQVQNDRTRLLIKWIILAFIILIGATLAIFASIYTTVLKPANEIRETIQEDSFFTIATHNDISIGTHKGLFLQTLTSNVQKAEGGMTQFVPVSSVSGTARPLTTQEFLSFIEAPVSRSLSKTFEQGFMIGSVKTSWNEPFIILRSYAFDALFAGFLEWEPQLQETFMPLFGDVRSDALVFTDAIQNNASTRILRDSTGNEVLLYSFVNQHTVVITTSSRALAEIIKQF